MTTREKGDISEATLIAAFLRNGYIVLRPFSDSLRYDVVIDRGNGFERVQCKTGRLQKGAVVFRASSLGQFDGKSYHSYRGEIELFGIYCPELNQCFLVSVHEVSKTVGSLRLTATKNGQQKGVKFAKDFLLM